MRHQRLYQSVLILFLLHLQFMLLCFCILRLFCLNQIWFLQLAKKRKRAEQNKKLGVKRLKLQPILKPKVVSDCKFHLKGKCEQVGPIFKSSQISQNNDSFHYCGLLPNFKYMYAITMFMPAWNSLLLVETNTYADRQWVIYSFWFILQQSQYHFVLKIFHVI